MKKLFAWFVLPVFLTPLTVISTEQDLVLSNSEQFQLLAHASYFSDLPENPRLYETITAYADQNLTQLGQVLVADQRLVIKRLMINDQLTPVFELLSGDFIPASQLLVFDDKELSRATHEAKVWLKPEAKVYDRPLVFGANVISSSSTPFEAGFVTQVATTYSGTYYYLDGKGWVDQMDLYEEPMEALQALLTREYDKPHVSIYVERLDDGQTAQVNADKLMYGASVTKLATIYEVQEQLRVGQLTLSDQLSYVPEVHQYRGFYNPEGAGYLSKEPDGKSYTVEELLWALTQHSDNVASNILSYHTTKKGSRTFQTELKLLIGSEWDLVSRDLSAKAAGLMMAELYHQDGIVLDYLSETAFDDQRISRDIPVRVAHKVGDADEFRHDVAIVYADRPFVLSIFTENASYEDITAIANDVYKILK